MESLEIIAHYDWWTKVGSIKYNWSNLLKIIQKVQCQQIRIFIQNKLNCEIVFCIHICIHLKTANRN